MSVSGKKSKKGFVDNREKKTLHGYVYGESIGRGSFGSVYRVEKGGRNYAIKEIPMANLEGKDKEHCDQEVKAMKSFKHPNLVAFHESFYKPENQKLYIVMEFCSKGSLKEYITKQKDDLDEDTIQEILKQIAKALEYLHGNRMIHRDVKPANVFIADDNTLKLGDMALVRNVSTNFAATKLAGTPLYMSPEIIQCQQYDFKPKQLSSSISDRMNSLFLDMMKKDPKDRPNIGCVLTRLQTPTHKASVTRHQQDSVSVLHSMSPGSSPRAPPDRLREPVSCSTRSVQHDTGSNSRSGSQRSETGYSQRSTYRPSSSTRSRHSPDSSPQSSAYSRRSVDSNSRRSNLGETSDYGTDTETRPEGERGLVEVEIKVLMTEDDYGIYKELLKTEETIKSKADVDYLKNINSLLHTAYEDERGCEDFVANSAYETLIKKYQRKHFEKRI